MSSGFRSGFIAAGAPALIAALALPGCKQAERAPDLGRIYNGAAQQIGEDRTPVVVIPGILGTKLEDSEDGTKVWGAFVYGAADADKPDGARRIAIPMASDVPLAALTDTTIPTEVLDRVIVDIGPLRSLELGAYADILETLAAGKYRDSSFGEAGAIDYGGLHYTCFQNGYDWRRDVSESVYALHEEIQNAISINREARGLTEQDPLKVDVVAHSMGGLLLRYYLRYGPSPLPSDGTLPPLTWEGARYVRHAILIGTPNAGSVLAFQQLCEGMDLNPLFPNYRPAVLGTMPAVYQLLPRTRHARIVDAETGLPLELFDADVWEQNGWGLLNPKQDKVLKWLLPDIEDAAQRRRVAFDHVEKCLAQAKQFHQAIDRPAAPPTGCEIMLFAGDADDTPARIVVDRRGRLKTDTREPGDGTVTRASALGDERVGLGYAPQLRSPIDWARVQFIGADHLGLTRTESFVDNLLYLLLEAPDQDKRPTRLP